MAVLSPRWTFIKIVHCLDVSQDVSPPHHHYTYLTLHVMKTRIDVQRQIEIALIT